MKLEDMGVRRVYAYQETSRGVIRPAILLDRKRMQKVNTYNSERKLWCPPSQGRAYGGQDTKGALVLVLRNEEREMVAWVRDNKAAEDHPMVAEALAGVKALLDVVRNSSEFMLEYKRGEWPSGVDVVRPQTIKGLYGPVINEQYAIQEARTRQRQHTERETERVLNEARSAYARIKEAVGVTDGDPFLKPWFMVTKNEVRVPVADLTVIADALAALSNKENS